MKTIVILAAASLAFVGCNKQDSTMGDSARTEKDQIEQSKDAQKAALNDQKKSIEQVADQAQDQLSAQAKADKAQIEAQADAQKAQIDAEKKQIDAQAAAAKADVSAQAKINEAAGATTDRTVSINANTTDRTIGVSANATDTDKMLTQQIRQSFTTTLGKDNPTAVQNIMVTAKDGKVTLKGSVKTDAEKKNLEAQVKAMPGVTSIDNQLEVK
ncbi:MAG: BON domain-containing protein [Verrucomicrobiota bacterium]